MPAIELSEHDWSTLRSTLIIKLGKTVSLEEREDVAQQAILAMLGQAAAGVEIRHPMSWSLQVANWILLKQLKRQKCVPMVPIDPILELKGEDAKLPQSLINSESPESIFLKIETEQALIALKAKGPAYRAYHRKVNVTRLLEECGVI